MAVLSYIFNSKKKQFLYFFSTLIFSVILIDFSIYNILKIIHSETFFGQTGGKISYALNKATEFDTLIMGSSKAYHNVNTKLMQRSYNLGHDGSRILSNLAILDLLNKHNKLPKVILLHTDPGLYFKSDSSNFYSGADINMVSVFYNQSEIIKTSLRQNSENWILYELFNSYAFNGKVLSLLKNFLKTKIKSTLPDSGFKPLPYNDNEQSKFLEFLKVYHNIDNEKFCCDDKFALSLLKEFIAICKKNNIKLICFNAPEYLGDIPFVTNLRIFLANENVQFFDYSDIVKINPEFEKTKYWKDNAHLNEMGANIFTSIFIKDIIHENN